MSLPSLLRQQSFLVRGILIIAFMVHGIWNLSSEGLRWWQTGQHLFPPVFSYLAGMVEILCAVSLYFGKWLKLSTSVLSLMMATAMAIHWPQGFSYKNMGYEVPMVYLLLCLDLLLARERFRPLHKLFLT